MKTKFETVPQFVINTIVSVDDLLNYDLIYIYPHLEVGAIVQLEADGCNVKGELRYRVYFKAFMLGFITIGWAVQEIYTGLDRIEGEIVHLNKQKFLPIRGIDLCLQATKMRMVS